MQRCSPAPSSYSSRRKGAFNDQIPPANRTTIPPTARHDRAGGSPEKTSPDR